jgi:hypothetical protein
MSKSGLSNKEFGVVTSGLVNTNQIAYSNKGSVTQANSLTSGVTLNSPIGAIRTVSTSLATSGSAMFTCANSVVTASKYVMANIIDYTGTFGTPSVIVDNITKGSFAVRVRNSHLTAELNGSLAIAFQIL